MGVNKLTKEELNNIEKQEKVYNFLLTPIKNFENIANNKKYIITAQRYKKKFDPDMSDVAVCFYKIIYGLDILDDNGELKDKNFAGDTMCSFNTIANCVKEAGKSHKQRTEYKEWPNFLKNYYDFYHCLANFWLLPMQVGRSYPQMEKKYKSLSKSKKGFDDYMDSFLEFLKNDNSFEKFITEFESYGIKFKSFETFVDSHYLRGEENFISEKYLVNFFSKSGTPEEIVSSMEKKIRKRAKVISSQNELCDKLYILCNDFECSK